MESWCCPKKGQPEYLDPYNDVSSDPKNYVDFKAIILDQTKNETTGLEAALSGVTSLMPLSAKLAYKGGQTVKLSQIHTGGRRRIARNLNREGNGSALRRVGEFHFTSFACQFWGSVNLIVISLRMGMGFPFNSSGV